MAKLVAMLLNTADMLLHLFKKRNYYFVGKDVGLVKAMASQDNKLNIVHVSFSLASPCRCDLAYKLYFGCNIVFTPALWLFTLLRGLIRGTKVGIISRNFFLW